MDRNARDLHAHISHQLPNLYMEIKDPQSCNCAFKHPFGSSQQAWTIVQLKLDKAEGEVSAEVVLLLADLHSQTRTSTDLFSP